VQLSWFIVVVLLLVYIGYIAFAIYLFAREVPRGRQQQCVREERAARAAREAITTDQSIYIRSPKLPARAIKLGSIARRRHLVALQAKPPQHGESFELDDLSHASRHVRWQDQRSAPRQEETIDPRILEARIWSGLRVSRIEDVDDETRTRALGQMRQTQRPFTMDYGDDGLRSPVGVRGQ
jgi:hypothetical protein